MTIQLRCITQDTEHKPIQLHRPADNSLLVWNYFLQKSILLQFQCSIRSSENIPDNNILYMSIFNICCSYRMTRRLQEVQCFKHFQQKSLKTLVIIKSKYYSETLNIVFGDYS